MNVMVAGAGIGGLTAALALRRAGIEATVFERAGELGWGRSPGETPEEFRRRLSDATVLAETDDPRLARMTTAVVRAAYARAQPDQQAAHDVADDAEAVLHDLRATVPWRLRLLGLYRRS